MTFEWYIAIFPWYISFNWTKLVARMHRFIFLMWNRTAFKVLCNESIRRWYTRQWQTWGELINGIVIAKWKRFSVKLWQMEISFSISIPLYILANKLPFFSLKDGNSTLSLDKDKSQATLLQRSRINNRDSKFSSGFYKKINSYPQLYLFSTSGETCSDLRPGNKFG